ncbi:uncharacterized protein [Littorina saxatilis]|uniref:uncharacterized protein isoform X2 n=1 Tax=Littorina saxatilis TaxID=31220 RepID=UPI0038B56C09
MKFLILATLVVSASAFLNMPAATPQQTPPANNQLGPSKQMPDMNLVMQMVRQILMLLLPKLMANPSLMASFTGAAAGSPAGVMDFVTGKLATAGPAVGPKSKPMVPPMHAGSPTMGGMGPAAVMAAMGGRPNVFAPAAPAAPAYGAHAHGAGMYMPTGDAFKDMRIAELLRDPTLGFVTDPRVSAYIPPAGAGHYGLSLGDRIKDYIQYSLIRRRAPGRPLSAKENDLLHLIGDPPKEMMMPSYAARYGGAPAGGMGGGGMGMAGMASMAAGMAAMANMNQAMAGMNPAGPAAPGMNPPAVG